MEISKLQFANDLKTKPVPYQSQRCSKHPQRQQFNISHGYTSLLSWKLEKHSSDKFPCGLWMVEWDVWGDW